MKNKKSIPLSMYDPLAKYKSDKSIIEILIENCPMEDYTFDKILEARNANEEKVMELMVKCKEGEFVRTESGWEFIQNEE